MVDFMRDKNGLGILAGLAADRWRYAKPLTFLFYTGSPLGSFIGGALSQVALPIRRSHCIPHGVNIKLLPRRVYFHDIPYKGK